MEEQATDCGRMYFNDVGQMGDLQPASGNKASAAASRASAEKPKMEDARAESLK